MRFSLLLGALHFILKRASVKNDAFKRHIRHTSARILIKTVKGRGRLFIFEKGKLSSRSGGRWEFDVALVWKDAKTGFRVMTDKSPDASFNAAARGDLKVEGVSFYAQWFQDGINFVM